MTTKASADSFDRLRSRHVAQLDSLVPFLALSHSEIFDVLRTRYAGWYTDERRSTLPSTFDDYSQQVANAAFLLGYSYAEAFVTDLMYEVYEARRDLLPQDRHFTFGDILQLPDLGEVVRHMIETTVGDMNSLEAKLVHLQNAFGWQMTDAARLMDAHVARNALIHNAGHVNREPPAGSRWHKGDRIQFSAIDVHQFGILARNLARELCDKAKGLSRSPKRRSKR